MSDDADIKVNEALKRQVVDSVLISTIVGRAQSITGRFRDPTLAAFETVIEGWVRDIVNPEIVWVLSQPEPLTGHKADVDARFTALFPGSDIVWQGVRVLVDETYPEPASGDREARQRVTGCQKVIVALMAARELRTGLNSSIASDVRAHTAARGPWPSLQQIRQRIRA